MNDEPANDPWILERARQIATTTLAGKYDLLLACREIADLRGQLLLLCPQEDALDTLIGVASEVDGFPIGCERQYWAPDALKTKDAQLQKYREVVRPAVTDALQKLLVMLDAENAGDKDSR